MSSTIKDSHTGKMSVNSSPITSAFAITPNDSTDLAEITLSLYVSVAGALKVTMYDGSVVTYPTMVVGRHPLRVKRVWSTGTLATGLVGEA
jgi:hypothetical protein